MNHFTAQPLNPALRPGCRGWVVMGRPALALRAGFGQDTPHPSCGREAPEELTGSREAIFPASQKPYSSKCCKWLDTSSSALRLPYLVAAQLCQAVWTPLSDHDSFRAAWLPFMAASRGLAVRKEARRHWSPCCPACCHLPQFVPSMGAERQWRTQAHIQHGVGTQGLVSPRHLHLTFKSFGSF